MFKLRLRKKQKPYIVLLGDVGVGKSTLFEKLTGATGKSSRSDVSFTRVSEVYETLDRSMTICDTPGINSMDSRFQHNCNVAHALNYQAVSKILLVVKADNRLDTVVEKVSEALSCFIPEDLPLELLSVCITHMDTVQYDKNRLLQVLEEKVGIESVVTNSMNKTAKDLQSDLAAECQNVEPMEMNVNNEMFLKLFKISNSNIKVLRQVKREVNRFKLIKEQFNQRRRDKRWNEKDVMDMTFEFQAWMTDEITECQKRLAERNNFDLIGGPDVATQAGHIANMTNQLRKILSSVRIDAMKFHKSLDTNFRKCPWCPAVWQKIEGCDGTTTCGNRVSESKRSDDWSGGVTAHFAFVWDPQHNRLAIKKKALNFDDEKVNNVDYERGKQAGCGKSITWSEMSPVSVPVEFDINPASTEDIAIIQEVHLPTWKVYFNSVMAKIPKIRIRRK